MPDRSHPNGKTPPSNARPTEPRRGDQHSVHLLRTDLTLLIGRAQLLSRRLNDQDDPTPELRDALAALKRAAEHLLRLAEALPPAAPRQADDPAPSPPPADEDV